LFPFGRFDDRIDNGQGHARKIYIFPSVQPFQFVAPEFQTPACLVSSRGCPRFLLRAFGGDAGDWSWPFHDAFKDSEMQSNAIIVGRLLYATTPKMRVVALNAETGSEVWGFNPAPGSEQRRFRHRGVTIYQDRLFFTCRNFLYALDRLTGSRSRGSATTAASTCASASTVRRTQSALAFLDRE
jgi:outer membrane protein assembly factor BamB